MAAAAVADLHGISVTRDDEIFDVVASVDHLSLHRRRRREACAEPNGKLTMSCRRVEQLTGPQDLPCSQG